MVELTCLFDFRGCTSKPKYTCSCGCGSNYCEEHANRNTELKKRLIPIPSSKGNMK